MSLGTAPKQPRRDHDASKSPWLRAMRGLIKAVGGALRAGGEDAERVREALASMLSIEPVRTGAELVAFLRASPLVGEELMIERDQSPGRHVDLE